MPTHRVFVGDPRAFRYYMGYVDGDVMRDTVTGEVVARRTKKGWNRTVRTIQPKTYHCVACLQEHTVGQYDHIKPLNKVAVTVHLDKGIYY